MDFNTNKTFNYLKRKINRNTTPANCCCILVLENTSSVVVRSGVLAYLHVLEGGALHESRGHVHEAWVLQKVCQTCTQET